MAIAPLFSLIFGLMGGAVFSTQNFHTTTATANYSAQDRSLRVELEVFADNLNELLTALTEQEVDISLLRDQKAANEVLEEYLAQNFYFVQNGKVLPLAFLEMEIKNDKAILILEAEILSPENVTIKNTLFFTLFPDQINIVNVRSAENYNTYYFNQKTPQSAIKL